MSPADDRGGKAHTYSQSYFIETDRARISGTFTSQQNDAWFLPSRAPLDEPEFEVEFYATGAPISIRFQSLLRSTFSLAQDSMVALAPNAELSHGAQTQPGVMHLRRPPFERPGSFGSGGVFDPIDPLPPNPQPPAGAEHTPCTIRLYPPNRATPIQTWEIEGGLAPLTQTVEFAPHLPPPAAFEEGWWRCTLAVRGPDPARVRLKTTSVIGTAPIQTEFIPKRLLNRMLGLVVGALTPDVRVVNRNKLSISIGEELAGHSGVGAIKIFESISPVESNAKLRTFAVELVSGADVIAAAETLVEVAKNRLNAVPQTSSYDAMRIDFNRRLGEEQIRLAGLRTAVRPEYVAIKFKMAFQDARIRIAGFDVASIVDEMGEVYLAFPPDLNRVVPLVDVEVDFSSLASALGSVANLLGLTDIKLDEGILNDLIHSQIIINAGEISGYLRDALGRLVSMNGFAVSASATNRGWNVRYFVDLPEPRNDDPFRPVGPSIATPGTGPAVVSTPDTLPPGVNPLPQPQPDTGPRPPADDAVPWPDDFVVADGPALDRLDRIGTIVVVMMENRSFDHLLGDLARSRPRPGDAYTCRAPDAKNAAAGGFAKRIPVVEASRIGLDTAIFVSPHHGVDHVKFQIGGGTRATAGSGAMDGFARDVASRTDAPQTVMSYYTERELPTYYRLADEFKVCDHWFCAHPGATFPNRWATLEGEIPEVDNLETDDPRLGFLPGSTIFGVLDEHNIDWRYFESNISMMRMYDRYRLNDEKVVGIDDPVDGLDAVLNSTGPLPRVIFIDPNFVELPPVANGNDDHPPSDLARGQAFIANICNKLWASQHWESITLLVTYDEHGGFYDHVAPPGTAQGPQEWIGRIPKIHPDGEDFMGARVPTLLVSPFVDAGSISHQVFDHTSIIKTILVRHRDTLSPSAFRKFGPRVRAAAHLGQALDLDTPRPRPVPFSASAAPAPGGPTLVSTLNAADVFAHASSAAPVGGTHPSAPNSTVAVDPTETRALPDSQTEPPPTVSFELEGWDELPNEPRDFHVALRRAMAPRRKQ